VRPLYESARAVQAALNVGVSYQDFGTLLSRMSAQLLLTEDRVNLYGVDQQERNAAKQYSALLAMYRDSMTVWGLEIRDAHDDPQLPALAAKYGVPDATGVPKEYGVSRQYAAFSRLGFEKVETRLIDRKSRPISKPGEHACRLENLLNDLFGFTAIPCNAVDD
jgi:hypothetical protein